MSATPEQSTQNPAAEQSTADNTPELELHPGVTISGLREDLLVHTRERNGRPAWRYTIDLLLTTLLSSGFHMMLIWRLGAWCHKCKLLPLSILAEKLVYHLYHCCIPCSVQIGPGMWVPHPLGIVFSSRARIGRNVWVRQHVQIVHVWEGDESGRVGDYAQLNTAAILIRGAVVSHSAVVGAAALVNSTIPPEHVAFGQPAKARPMRPEQIPSRQPRYK